MYVVYNFPEYNKDYAKIILKHFKKKGTIYIHKDLMDYKEYFQKKILNSKFEIIKTLKNCKELEKKYTSITFEDIYAIVEYNKHFKITNTSLNIPTSLKNLEFIYDKNSSGKTRKILDYEKELNATQPLYKLYNLSTGFITMSMDAWYNTLYPGMSQVDSKLLSSLEKECKTLSNEISFLKGKLVVSKSERTGDENSLNAKELIETSLNQYKSQLNLINLKSNNTTIDIPESNTPWNIPGIIFSSEFDVNQALETTNNNFVSELYYNILQFDKLHNLFFSEQLKFLKTRIKKLETQHKSIIELQHINEIANVQETQDEIKKKQDELNLKMSLKKKIKNGYFKKQYVDEKIDDILKYINGLKMTSIIYSRENSNNQIIINKTFKNTHFSNFEILIFELGTRFYLQKELLLVDEMYDIIHEKKQFLNLLKMFPFKHQIIVTHRAEFTTHQ